MVESEHEEPLHHKGCGWWWTEHRPGERRPCVQGCKCVGCVAECPCPCHLQPVEGEDL